MPHPEVRPRVINTNYSTAPAGDGQSPSAPNNLKYVFAPAQSTIFDVEIFPNHWCCGFLTPDGKHKCIDGDRTVLAETLDRIAATGRTLVGYNSQDYDLPILRAILAGEDPYPVSRLLVAWEGYGLPPELRDRASAWPIIEADHIDLCARTKNHGRFPGLKTVAANLGCRYLQGLPYPPDRELTDSEWSEVLLYNRKDLLDTRLALEHFTPELQAIAALSNRYRQDLQSTHQAAIASKVLCRAFRDWHGMDPTRIPPPASVRYVPPAPIRRPQNPAAAEWHDRLVGEPFLLQGDPPKPEVPEPSGPIIING